MGDIFGYNRSGNPTSVFSSEDATLTIAGRGQGYMIQQWQVAYQQNVQEIYELGSGNMYWIKGQPQGAGSVGRIVGQTGAGTDFFDADSFDMCRGGGSIAISASSGICNNTVAGPAAQTVLMRMEGVVVTSIGFSSSVQDMMFRENVGWRFAKFSM